MVSGQRTEAAITSSPHTRRRDVQRQGPRPAQRDQSAEHDVRQVGAVHQRDAVGEQPPEHRSAAAAGPAAAAAGAGAAARRTGAPVSATVDSSRTESACPAGQRAGSPDSAIGRDTSKVAAHSRQRYS